jgi:hypothetical protein
MPPSELATATPQPNHRRAAGETQQHHGRRLRRDQIPLYPVHRNVMGVLVQSVVVHQKEWQRLRNRRVAALQLTMAGTGTFTAIPEPTTAALCSMALTPLHSDAPNAKFTQNCDSVTWLITRTFYSPRFRFKT